MADQTVVHMGENSPEHVAFRLLVQVAVAEDKRLPSYAPNGKSTPDRKWILDTYAECLEAVRGIRDY